MRSKQSFRSEISPTFSDQHSCKQIHQLGTTNLKESLLDKSDYEDYSLKASVPQTIFNLTKFFLGISIIAIPASFQSSGLIGGVVGVIAWISLNIFTVFIQTKAAVRLDEGIESLSELGMKTAGPLAKYLIDAFILIGQMGLNVSYLMFNGTQVDNSIWKASKYTFWDYKNTYILVALIVLVPLWWLKSLRLLSYVSIITLILMFSAYAVVTLYSFETIVKGEDHYEEIRMFDPLQFPYFVGIAMIGFNGNSVSLNIRASMENPKRFNFAFYVSALIVGMITCIIGALGYIAYGNETKEIITLNLPHNAVTLFIQLAYCAGLFGTYPMQMIPLIDVIEKSQYYRMLPNLEDFNIKYYAVRAFYVIFTATLAISIPKFGRFLNFVGALSGMMVGIIIPFLVYEIVYTGKLSMKEKIFNRTILVIGTVLSGLSTFMSLLSLLNMI